MGILAQQTVTKTMRLTNGEAKSGGVIPRSQLYSVASAHSKGAIQTLAYLMNESKNENVRLGAARALLDKSLPDIKAVEVTTEEKPKFSYIIDLAGGYIPPQTEIQKTGS